MVLMPLLSRLLTLLVILTMPLFTINVTMSGSAGMPRSEERFSRNAETDLVCRLLLEKKNTASCGAILPKRRSSWGAKLGNGGSGISRIAWTGAYYSRPAMHVTLDHPLL